ncbi:hypothetical protein ACH4T9_19810 [Micromonospora sp. NPDC020750]|uniref:hypothetical protein n=1 Tax=unclassified Micromonospora TaxID=2617518 RepID=UPI00379B0E9F
MTHPNGGNGGTTGPGRMVTPLTAEARVDRYRRQTGSAELTPRQRRRRDHKANRAAARTA